MKKLIRAAIVIFCFLAALVLFDVFLNRNADDVTEEMSGASLPVVSFVSYGKSINQMCGYVSPRLHSYMKDMITPLSSDRTLSLLVKKYGASVNSIRYEVRSTDGKRLIESTDVTEYEDSGDFISFSVVLKDLIESAKEYSYTCILSLEDGREVYYYSQIILDESLDTYGKVDFVLRFSDNTFKKDDENNEIVTYIESDATGDNTNYNKVDIHSSYDQITWGDLDVSYVGPKMVYLEEMGASTARLSVKYQIGIQEGKITKYYNVVEKYRIRQGSERMYLLDFERTMDSIFEPENGAVFGNIIMVGIAKERTVFAENEDGSVVVFENEGSLYVCNENNNTLSAVYQIDNGDNRDTRTEMDNHYIKILSVDEVGVTDFVVYGYMVRGDHEGEVGVLFLEYDPNENTVEEKLFIPYAASVDLLKRNIEKLCYLGHNGFLFIYLDGNVYRIGVDDLSIELVVTGANDASFKTSESQEVLAYQTIGKESGTREIKVLNLNNGYERTIRATGGEYVSIVGFMGEDIIFGKIVTADIYTNAFGEKIYPMKELIIQNRVGADLKTYANENIYVTGCRMDGNMITMTRQEKTDKGFIDSTPDTILNNYVAEPTINNVEVVPTENYKKIVQIALKREMPKNTKTARPLWLMYEGSRNVDIDFNTKCNRYFVYEGSDIIGVYTNPSDAIKLAFTNQCVVMDETGRLVWKKGNLQKKNQIMAIVGRQAGEDESTLNVCLETILEFEGYPRKVEAMLEGGKEYSDILEEAIPDIEVMDLSGCELDSMLYFLNSDIPVLAYQKDGNAVLLVGYNELNTVWMNPKNGKVYKVGMEDSRTAFKEAGNRFITYRYTDE